MARKKKENIRQKILAAAESLFATKGFDATGIELIAKTAGITKSLIYYYFKSKDEILNALFDNFIKKTIDQKNRITQLWLTEPDTSVAKIIREHSLPFMMANKNVIKIAFSESIKEVEETPHLNIFKYFDQNFHASYDIAEKMGLKQVKTQRQLLSGFFLFFAPLFSFVIFSDEWCDHYKTDPDSTADCFADLIGKFYAVFYRSEIQNISLTEMLQNTQKP